MRYKIAAGLLLVALAISVFYNYEQKQKLDAMQDAMDKFLPAARMLEQQNMLLKQELTLRNKFPEVDQKAVQDSIRNLFKVDSAGIKKMEMQPSQFDINQPQTPTPVDGDFRDMYNKKNNR